MNYTLELGLKGLRRHPRTMLLAIATMALGLAATMTMLTMLAMLSADPLPGLSQHLYLGWVDSRQAPKAGHSEGDNATVARTLWKLADVQALQEAHPDIRQSALVSTSLTLASEDGARKQSGPGVLALGPMPSMFGVALRHGRYWNVQEERERTPVAIIDRATSLKLFGSENGIGRSVRIGKGLFRVIGISDGWAPRPAVHFLQNENGAWDSGPDIAFVPALAALDNQVVPISAQECDDTGPHGIRFNDLDVKACRWLALWAELPTSTRMQDYQRYLLDYARQRHADGMFQRPPAAGLYGVAEWLRLNRVVPDSVRLNLWLALGLLALCLVNVAGLLAARLLRRSGELGVRRVLGAPRRSVTLQCLVESGAAGLLGGLLALPLTLFGLWVVRLQDRSYTDMAHLHPSLFLVLLGLALVCGLLVGALPAWRAARLEPALQVKSL
ncbi:MAG: ABC transporter permease [Pseudoxanthomonas sp.]